MKPARTWGYIKKTLQGVCSGALAYIKENKNLMIMIKHFLLSLLVKKRSRIKGEYIAKRWIPRRSDARLGYVSPTTGIELAPPICEEDRMIRVTVSYPFQKTLRWLLPKTINHRQAIEKTTL